MPINQQGIVYLVFGCFFSVFWLLARGFYEADSVAQRLLFTERINAGVEPRGIRPKKNKLNGIWYSVYGFFAQPHQLGQSL